LRQEVQPAVKYLEVPQRLYEELYKAKQDAREREKTHRNADRLRSQQTGRGSLIEFVRYFWHTLEPQSRQLVEGRPLEAICLHLEAVTFGDIKRLLINVPPGFMKSLLTDVFWPQGRHHQARVLAGVHPDQGRQIPRLRLRAGLSRHRLH
jgi:hypothetical protein